VLSRQEIEFLTTITKLALLKNDTISYFKKYAKTYKMNQHNNKQLTYHYFGEEVKFVDNTMEYSEAVLYHVEQILTFNKAYVLENRQLKVHEKYLRDEIFMINGIIPKQNIMMSGQVFLKDRQTFYLFINIDAEKNNHRMISQNMIEFILNKNAREGQMLLSGDYRMLLFARYNNLDYSRFYFMGEAKTITTESFVTDSMIKAGNVSAQLKLKTPIIKQLILEITKKLK